MSYYITFDSSGGLTLAHHGILGQKWGVRRYQNKDGSLTPAGKTRYLHDLEKEHRKATNAIAQRIGPKQRLVYKPLPKEDNVKALRDQIEKEHKESAEYAEEQKAWNDYGTKEARSKFKSNDDEFQAESKYYDAHIRSSNKLYELGQKHYREFVEARLKDYDLPHSKEYVDIAEEYMRKHNWQYYY